MILALVSLAAGLALLVFAGDYLVKGAVGLAENLGIPPLIIGLTIVAFGTSAPEMFVSIQSALAGAPGIAIGNVVGSNIANVLIVMGLPALVASIHADQPGLGRNVAVMVAFTLGFMLVMNDGMLSRLDGLMLFGALILFIVAQILRAQNDRAAAAEMQTELAEAPHSAGKIALFIIGGLIGLPIGAQLTVDGATFIARTFGVSDAAIGLTIVAIGTSLPELATSFIAAMKRSSDIALGNIIGSNIFNIGAIMGVTAMIVPVPVDPHFLSFDNWVMLAVAVLLTVICYGEVRTGKRLGAAMLLAYAAFLVAVF